MLFFVPIAMLFFHGIQVLSHRKSPIYRYLAVAFMVIILLSQCYDTIHRNKTWKSGYTLWNDVLNKSPGLSESHTNMAFLLRKQGRYQEAEKALKEAIRLDSFTNKSSKMAAFLGLVRNNYTLEKYEDAINTCKTAMRMTDRHQYFKYYMLGLIHQKTGDYEIAIDEFNAALSKNAKFVEAMMALGDLYLEIQEPVKALAMFKKARVLLPEDLEVRVNEAIAHRMKGEPRKAVTLLKPIVSKFDRNNQWSVKAVLALLECQHDLGDKHGIKRTRTDFLSALAPGMIDTIHTFLLQNKAGLGKHIRAELVLAILNDTEG